MSEIVRPYDAPKQHDPRLIAPLRIRNFRLLLAGQGISTLGDAFFGIALPFLLLTEGAGTTALGLVLACLGVARIVTMLLGGVLSDRLGPRRVMLWSDVLRAVLMVMALVLMERPPLWTYCALAAALGACGGVFLPAAGAILPDILPDDALPAGNALWGVTIPLAALVGSALGGIVVSHFAAGYALAIDAGSYVVSVITLVLMRHRNMAQQAREVVSAGGQEITFWHYLLTSRLLQVTLVVVVVSNLVDGGLEGVALPVLSFGPFHAGAAGYGVLVAVSGASTLVGGLVGGIIHVPARRGLFALSCLAGDGIGMALLPYLGGVAGASVALVIWGVANGLRDIIYYTLLQQIIPRHLLGRMMGVILFATFGVYPISVAGIGFGVARLGPVVVFPIGGVVMLLSLLLGISQREIRRVA